MNYEISLIRMDGAVQRFEYTQNSEQLYREGYADGYNLATYDAEDVESEKDKKLELAINSLEFVLKENENNYEFYEDAFIKAVLETLRE